MGLFDDAKAKPEAKATTAPNAVAENAVKAETPVKEKSAKAIAWEKARDKILAYIADEKNNVPADIVEAAKTFRPSFFGITSGGGFAKKEHPAHVEKLMKLLGVEKFEDIKVGAHFDELKAFTTLKFGRKEMRWLCIDNIKRPDDKGAIYIDFDAVKGVYTIKGVGAEPEGWTGYRPADKDAE